MLAAIFGLAGERVTDEERRFFEDADPAGYIIFKRNCVGRDQLRALTDDLRSIHGRADLPILIDQEGGRVARMSPPEWPALPRAELFDELYRKAPMSAIEAARANAGAIAALLRDVGINVDCLPLLDVRQIGASDIIGDRALGSEPMQVAALGRAVIDGLRAGGVVGVVKHMPGHGRALCDSHVELPIVEADEETLAVDLHPFVTLRDAPMGMMAHVVYTQWDPQYCASLSRAIISRIIRGRIGFDGLLISDDIGMEALKGDFEERARGVVSAGCDLALHCSGDMDEMLMVAAGAGPMSVPGEDRLRAAMATIKGVKADAAYKELAETRDRLLAYA